MSYSSMGRSTSVSTSRSGDVTRMTVAECETVTKIYSITTVRLFCPWFQLTFVSVVS